MPDAPVLALVAALLAPPTQLAPPPQAPALTPLVPVQTGRRATCKQMRTCREAVILWCSGYGRADGDGDGIPCDTVCASRRQVEAILKEIGCRR